MVAAVTRRTIDGKTLANYDVLIEVRNLETCLGPIIMEAACKISTGNRFGKRTRIG